MKQRTLLILTAITLVIAVAAIISSRSRAPQTSFEKSLLFPNLAEHVNDVTEIVIEGQGKALNLVKKNDSWSIEQSGGYPALFTKIKPVIISASEFRIAARKTSNPDLYSRLGVDDPAGERATSWLLTLRSDITDLASVIIGKQQKNSGSTTGGQYVRVPGEEQSLLVDGSVDISTDVTDWIERNLFNIAPERIKRIQINHPGDDDLVLHRDNDIDHLSIENLPEGKEPLTEVVVTRMETLLEDMFINDINSAEAITFPEDRTVTTIKTFDGLVVTVTSARIDDRNFSHFSFSFDESAAEEATNNEADAADKPDVREEAEALNGKYASWVFVVPDFKFELLVQNRDNILKDKKAAGKEKTGS